MSDFINIWDYADDNYPFQIFIGGRGTGKTYSSLGGTITPEARNSHNMNKFIYMRRTRDEADILQDSERDGEGANPFKKLNEDKGTNIGIKKFNKKMGAIYERTFEDDKYNYVGCPIGFTIGLTALAGLRSLDFSDVSDIFYDEFIKEKHIKAIKNECDALLNGYETINRNREFFNLPPCRLWLLSNSNDIYNDYFVTLDIVNICEKMIARGISDKYILERGLAIHILPPSKSFKEKKDRTAIARLTKGTRYYDMAYNNSFAYNDFSLISHRNIRGYIPFCSINNRAYLYKKKGSSEYYISYAKSRVENFNVTSEQGRRSFMARYGLGLIEEFTNSNIIFESYELKALILDLLL